jgi:hypothetical protein
MSWNGVDDPVSFDFLDQLLDDNGSPVFRFFIDCRFSGIWGLAKRSNGETTLSDSEKVRFQAHWDAFWEDE